MKDIGEPLSLGAMSLSNLKMVNILRIICFNVSGEEYFMVNTRKEIVKGVNRSPSPGGRNSDK